MWVCVCVCMCRMVNSIQHRRITALGRESVPQLPCGYCCCLHSQPTPPLPTSYTLLLTLFNIPWNHSLPFFWHSYIPRLNFMKPFFCIKYFKGIFYFIWIFQWFLPSSGRSHKNTKEALVLNFLKKTDWCSFLSEPHRNNCPFLSPSHPLSLSHVFTFLYRWNLPTPPPLFWNVLYAPFNLLPRTKLFVCKPTSTLQHPIHPTSSTVVFGPFFNCLNIHSFSSHRQFLSISPLLQHFISLSLSLSLSPSIFYFSYSFSLKIIANL